MALRTSARLRPAGASVAACITSPFLLRARIRPRGPATTALPISPPGLLLEFLHFALHELASLPVLAVLQLVKSAIGAALPTLGIGFLAG